MKITTVSLFLCFILIGILNGRAETNAAVKIAFKGKVVLADGTAKFAVKFLADKDSRTLFPRIGEEVRGFTVVEHKYVIHERILTPTPGQHLVLRKGTNTFTVIKGQTFVFPDDVKKEHTQQIGAR